MTRTTTASSPKVSLKRSVSSNVADERLTSVSGSALGLEPERQPGAHEREQAHDAEDGRLAASRDPSEAVPHSGVQLR